MTQKAKTDKKRFSQLCTVHTHTQFMFQSVHIKMKQLQGGGGSGGVGGGCTNSFGLCKARHNFVFYFIERWSHENILHFK